MGATLNEITDEWGTASGCDLRMIELRQLQNSTSRSMEWAIFLRLLREAHRISANKILVKLGGVNSIFWDSISLIRSSIGT
jgi:hypothetical protein